ncbi:aminoglycoside phosphotransferase family protein [Paractinoplanes atraurantiacus]|uniref:Phosphotransferase enzyme family protein n=1 Tax=Paractinoplanes atraurantiacus TaxID=1036182 RepID=A0A285JYJ7_9ACTN|nr:aminoglycoside phosphotransferase family protein [Actinoplanes atraurantiacus]SNY65348.1 Phosphotransferase enzyme family protein [Actinoplanes atraurantiacus]
MRENDWRDPEWVAAAHEWITRHLDVPAAGPIEEVRVRPWSVSHRVMTAAGARWFKANITGCRYEAGLAEALAEWVPGRTLAPIAVDKERGWLLTAEAGRTLREAGDGGDYWVRLLQMYASLQRDVAGRVNQMIALGVPDLRVARLPELAGGVREWCAELAADGIPATLQHDDLHDDNVFAGFRFFDWGDASVGHPFGSLLVALGVAGDDRAERLRDAYLEIWSDLGTTKSLRRSASLAVRLARVSKAMAWRRAVEGAALPVDEDFRTAADWWLEQLPEPAPI